MTRSQKSLVRTLGYASPFCRGAEAKPPIRRGLLEQAAQADLMYHLRRGPSQETKGNPYVISDMAGLIERFPANLFRPINSVLSRSDDEADYSGNGCLVATCQGSERRQPPVRIGASRVPVDPETVPDSPIFRIREWPYMRADVLFWGPCSEVVISEHTQLVA